MVIEWLVCPISSENLYTLEGRVCTTRSAVDRNDEVSFHFPTANGQAQKSADGSPTRDSIVLLSKRVQPAEF